MSKLDALKAEIEWLNPPLAEFDGGIGHLRCDHPCLFVEVARPSRASVVVALSNAADELVAVAQAGQAAVTEIVSEWEDDPLLMEVIDPLRVSLAALNDALEGRGKT